MKFALALLAGISLSAAVPTDTELTRGELTVRLERRTVPAMLAPQNLLLVHIRTASAADSFVVTLRVRLQSGSTVILREKVSRAAEPGTAGTTLVVPVRSIEEILSVTVEELFSPRVSDFS